MTTQVCSITNGTGTQGRSVARAMSEAGYRVRVLTRDTTSAKAKESIAGLANTTLVRCDVNDLNSVREAFEGAQVVYANSIPDPRIVMSAEGANTKSDALSEAEQGLRYCDVAQEKGVTQLIWSSLPDAAKNSQNTYRKIAHFQEKCLVSSELQTRNQPFVNLVPAMFTENLINYQMIKKTSTGELEFTFHRMTNTTKKIIPLIYVEKDLGRLAVVLFKNFDKVKGKTIKAFERNYSTQEMIEEIEKATGEKVKLVEKSAHVSEGSDMDEMWQYINDTRYPFYEGGDTPDENLEMLGFKFTPFSQFCKEKLATHFKAQ